MTICPKCRGMILEKGEMLSGTFTSCECDMSFSGIVARIENLERAVVKLQSKLATQHLGDGEDMKSFKHPIQSPSAKSDKKLVHVWDGKSQDDPLCGGEDGMIAMKKEQVTCPNCLSLLNPSTEPDKCKSCKNEATQPCYGTCLNYSAYEPKEVCKTCGGSKKIHVDDDTGRYYKPCPDCKDAKPKVYRCVCGTELCIRSDGDGWRYLCPDFSNGLSVNHFAMHAGVASRDSLIAELEKLPQKKET